MNFVGSIYRTDKMVLPFSTTRVMDCNILIKKLEGQQLCVLWEAGAERRIECIGLNNSLRATQPRRCDANTNEKQQLKVSPFSCILYTPCILSSPALFIFYVCDIYRSALLNRPCHQNKTVKNIGRQKYVYYTRKY